MKNSRTRKLVSLLATVFLLTAAICAPVLACEETYTNPARTTTSNDSLDFYGELTLNAQINFLLGLLDEQDDPNIDLSTDSLDFGEVEWMTESGEKEITISNDGEGDLVMAFRDFEGVNDDEQETGDDDKISDDTKDFILTADDLDYDEEDGTYTLEPGESGTITVVFKPRDIGDSGATLLCLSNDPDDYEIELSFAGTGIEPEAADAEMDLSDETLDFGEVEWSVLSDEQEIEISNEGDDDLVICFSDFEGANDEDQDAGPDGKISDDTKDFIIDIDGFAYDSSDETYTLEGGETGTIAVAFKPHDIGESSATLYCESNDPDNEEFELTFTGEGIEADDDQDANTGNNHQGNYVITGIPLLDQLISGVSATIQITFGLGQNFYTQGGQQVPMDAEPFVQNNRTYVPLRYLGDALGADVNWDQENETAHLVKGGQDLSAKNGSNLMWLNDSTAIPMDVHVLEKDGRLYLPARYVAEQFGYNVDWDETNQLVLLNQ